MITMLPPILHEICLYINTCNYISYNKEKYRKTNIIIIHKKINLNGLSHKIGISQNWSGNIFAVFTLMIMTVRVVLT